MTKVEEGKLAFWTIEEETSGEVREESMERLRLRSMGVIMQGLLRL